MFNVFDCKGTKFSVTNQKTCEIQKISLILQSQKKNYLFGA